jgi:hypothetical protein
MENLVKSGDTKIKPAFKKEIIALFRTGNSAVVSYLLYEKYLMYLDEEDLVPLVEPLLFVLLKVNFTYFGKNSSDSIKYNYLFDIYKEKKILTKIEDKIIKLLENVDNKDFKKDILTGFKKSKESVSIKVKEPISDYLENEREDISSNEKREFKKLSDTVLQLPDIPISCEYTEWESHNIKSIVVRCRFKGFIPASTSKPSSGFEEKEIYFPVGSNRTAPYKFPIDLQKKNIYEQGDDDFMRFITQFEYLSSWPSIKKAGYYSDITKEQYLLEEARLEAKDIVFKGGVIIKVDENNNPTGEVF